MQWLETLALGACMDCGSVRDPRSATVIYEATPRLRVVCAECVRKGVFPAGRTVSREVLETIGSHPCGCGNAVGTPGDGGLVRVTLTDGNVDREVRCGACCTRLIHRAIEEASRSRPPAPVAPDDGLHWLAPDVVARVAAVVNGAPCAGCPAFIGTGPAMVPGHVGLVLRKGAWHALAVCTACTDALGVDAASGPATQALIERAAARRPS